MAPIRIGFIGFNSTGNSWGVWAHLPYLSSTSKYSITAVCNSSVESAKTAIKTFGLPANTKAYGSPQDLAKDPDVDLVVCSLRVDKHYDAMMPAIEAGKDVFCEWPLAKDLKQAEEMQALAKKKGVRTMVGLQALQSPLVRKVKEVVNSGKIGKVLSTTFHGTPTLFGAKDTEMSAYCNDIEIGGNMLTIYASHSLEAITEALTPLKSYTSIIEVTRPTISLISSDGSTIRPIPRTSHDEILLQGHLTSGALLSYHLRGGPAFANTEGAYWRIYGEKGEIAINGSNSYLQISDDDAEIKVFDHETGNTVKVEVEKDALSGLGLYSRNIGRLYEAFARREAKGNGDKGYLDWEDAVVRHKFVEEVYSREREGKQESEALFRKV